MLQYACVDTNPMGENGYLVWDAPANTWLIDPGAPAEDFQRELEARGLTPSLVIFTHGHFDHIAALDGLCKIWPSLPIYMAAKDAEWAFTHPVNQYPPYYALQQRPAQLITEMPETLSQGGLKAKLISTPGHTPGGQCIYFEQSPNVAQPLCFTGDTLFTDSIGRTDLPGGSFGELNASLKKLTALPLDTTFLPGHGPSSTLERQLKTNPYLQPEPDF